MSKLLEERQKNTKIYNELSLSLQQYEEKTRSIYSKLNNYTINECSRADFKLLLSRMKKYAFLAEEIDRQIDQFYIKQNARILFYLGSQKDTSFDSKIDGVKDYYYLYDIGVCFTEDRSFSKKRSISANEIDVSDIFVNNDDELRETTPFLCEQKMFYINIILESMLKARDYQTWEEFRRQVGTVITLIRNGKSIDEFVNYNSMTK